MAQKLICKFYRTLEVVLIYNRRKTQIGMRNRGAIREREEERVWRERALEIE